jgi:hypothetical protein
MKEEDTDETEIQSPLTTASIIEFEIEKRNIRRDGKPMTIRVLRVSSYDQK